MTSGRHETSEDRACKGSFDVKERPPVCDLMSGMRISLRAVSTALLVLVALASLAVGQPESPRHILLIDVRDAIGPAGAEFIALALDRAAKQDAAAVILRVDTPGGLETSMRDIIRGILASPVAVATYVGPPGARAASAGTYILYASHIAAMAPGTNLGAATPVNLQGPPTGLPGGKQPSEKNEDDKEKPTAPKSDASSAKAINDSAAYIESLAELRGRNAEWAVKAVREAASLPASKALDLNVIDMIAGDIPDLIGAMEGRSVMVAGNAHVLKLAGLPVKTLEPSWRIKLLAVITNPNIALLLMMVGVYGLILEFYNPGTFVAGTIGGISLLLGLYALNVLPVNFAGIALIALGLVLIVAEAFSPSFGMLGLGGGAAFIIGATMLFETDAPEFHVSIPFLITTTALLGGLVILFLTLALRARRLPLAAGEENAIGTPAKVIDWAGSSGTVLYRGERWQAEGPVDLRPGQDVVIAGRNGLVVNVTPRISQRRD